ncbi:MAG: transporter substrate-binding domain-containing protein [Pseudomonadota bacterium]
MKKMLTLMILAGVLGAPALHAKEWKEVVIAMDATYPPFESVAPDGALVGFEVDLANALCVEMKVKCRLVNVGWDALIPGLVAKKHDALMTSMNVTEERKRAIDFSNTYYLMQNRFVAKKGSNTVISKDGLKGKTIAVQTGSAQDNFVTEQFGDVATIKRYTGAGEPYLELLNGRADLHFGSVVQIGDGFLSKGGNDKKFEFVGPSYTGKQNKKLGEGVAVGVRKQDSELRERFNAGLAALKKNGGFKKIVDKYFPEDADDK